MIKRLINYFLGKKENWISLCKSRKILKNIRPVSIPASISKLYKEKWECFGRKPSDIYLKIYSSISGVQSENFVPENLYYNRIEPVLNNKSFTLAYADKNFYEKHLPEFILLFPEAYLRGINGKLYDKDYNKIEDLSIVPKWIESDGEYILKPASETSGGANILLLKTVSQKIKICGLSLDYKQFIQYLQNVYKNNFILQERIIQHSFYADFNQSSINTVRIFTYKSAKDDQVITQQSVLRFGKPGMLVDNQASGGFSIGINENGFLNDFYINKLGIKTPMSGNLLLKQKLVLPGYEIMKEIACSISKKYYYHSLLGFDFCFSANGVVRLLEINLKNIETNFLQMNNGPLFGSFTDEIIEYCLKNKKSIVLDFEI
jgi:hypothetical protein